MSYKIQPFAMKAIRFITYAGLLFTFFAYAGCKKTDKCCSPGPDPIYTPEPVTAGVEGRVVDENNVPVSGAVIKAGSASTTTDVNGSFSFTNASLDKRAGFVKVEKDGFFQGSRTFSVLAGSTHYVTIQLIKKTVAGTVNSASGGNVTVPSGGSISFAGNSFMNTATNASYAGSVSVNAFYINPSASNINDIMPGALRAANGNQLIGLRSFGMMAVELTGASGEKLQLASGKQATVTFPIPTNLQAQAPATIALWSFNDTTGLWKQEGTATKEGNNYVAKVGHFSFWNCDDPFNIVDFKVTLKDKSGNPLPKVQVVLKIKDATNDATSGFTDNSGAVWGPVPLNKGLTMTVYNSCGSVVHTQDIGPFAANTDMGAITINTAAPVSLTVTGTVVNCTGNLVTNGQVNILLNNKNYRALLNNGNFSITLERCDNTSITAKLQAFDFDANQQGTETSLSVGTGAVNAGQLSACGSTINEYVNYTLNGKQVSIVPPHYLYAITYEDTTYIESYINDQTNFSSIGFKANASGTVPVSEIVFETQSPSARWTRSGNVNITITENGAVGSYVAGYFSGNVTNGTTIAPVTYRFRVKRKS
jgi:hypothetical protein